ncbi:MAG TPA: SDR family oxidoreductase [Polyangiales bacterium]
MSEILVTGAGGQLGSVLMRVLEEQRRSAHGLCSPSGPRPDVGKVFAADLCEPRSYEDRLFSLDPKVIIHLAAVSQIAQAYDDPDLARQVNVEATVQLLRFADALGARFIYASSDLVFDGEAAPYDEAAATEPLSFYGRTKLEAECHVLAYRRGLCVRLPLMYGFAEAQRAPAFFETLVNALRAGRSVKLFEDEVRTPLWLDDAARACVSLADSEHKGVMHAGGPERLSRYAMGEQVAQALGVSASLLERSRRADVATPEPRARDVSLDSSRYAQAFGAAPGRSLRQALPELLARRGSRALS